VGLKAFRIPSWYGSPTTKFTLLPMMRTAPDDDFARLIEDLNGCYEREVKKMARGGGFVCIVFCRSCRRLSLAPMRDAHSCEVCGADLRLQ